MEPMFPLREVARMLAISPRSVWRLVATQDLAPPVKVRRSARWFESDVRAYQERLRGERDTL
jgi:predicted DNA-binding transcriptional regulator AlpA